jgi:hypothetical protein
MSYNCTCKPLPRAFWGQDTPFFPNYEKCVYYTSVIILFNLIYIIPVYRHNVSLFVSNIWYPPPYFMD